MAYNRCLDCYYSRFCGFVNWCGHPDNDNPIKNPYRSCECWVDRDAKQAEGFKKRVPLAQSLKKYAANKP